MNALTPSSAALPDNAPVELQADSAPAASVQIDVRRIFAAIYRNRIFIAAILLVSIVVGIIVTLSTLPVYKASASIQIDSQVRQVLGTDDEAQVGNADYDVDRFLQTNLDVLRSRAIAVRVANSLNLAGNDDFFRRMMIEAPVSAAPGMTMAETRRDVIASVLQGNLTAEVPRNSRVVEIAWTSPDAAYAAKIVNAYAESFIEANLQRRFESSAYARKYLEEQLALAKERLEASERAQVDYARRMGLVDVETRSQEGEQATSTSLLLENLVNANEALNVARNERIRAEERYRAAASGSLLSIPEVQASSAIQGLLQQRAVASSESGRDSGRYLPDHPVMLQHAERLRSIDRQINSIAQQIRESLRHQYQAAQRNEAQLAGQVSALKSGNQSEQAGRVQYNILAREASTNRTMYNGLLQRYKEVSASAGVSTNNISLVDPAQVPGSPIRPRPLINLLIAIIAGLAASVAFVVIRDYYDDATRTPDDVINKLRVPFIGILPKMPADTTAGEILDDPKSSMSEAFAALRTSIGLLSTDGAPRTLMVTSSRESEGKSMVAYGIARSFARLGQKVVVVDADLRRPTQHRLFNLERDHGLTNILTRQAQWSEVVQKTSQSGVDFIASGPLPPSVPELLQGGNFEALIADLHQSYDLVMIDAPPVLGLADAILLGHMTRHLIYVVEAGRALRGRGLAAIRRLKAAKIKIDGAVLNKFDPKHAGYGYEYGYYYYYGKEQ